MNQCRPVQLVKEWTVCPPCCLSKAEAVSVIAEVPVQRLVTCQLVVPGSKCNIHGDEKSRVYCRQGGILSQHANKRQDLLFPPVEQFIGPGG